MHGHLSLSAVDPLEILELLALLRCNENMLRACDTHVSKLSWCLVKLAAEPALERPSDTKMHARGPRVGVATGSSRDQCREIF